MIAEKLVRRYAELKREAPGCVVLMQVGAFMKVLNDDARTVSEVTGLKLQMSGSVDEPVVLGGFPRTGLDAYVGKLVRAGHSVAVAFQDSDKERNLEEVIRVNNANGATGRAAPSLCVRPARRYGGHVRSGLRTPLAGIGGRWSRRRRSLPAGEVDGLHARSPGCSRTTTGRPRRT